MYSSVLSAAVCGLRAYFVRVEVDIAQGLPGMEMIGSLSREAKEARERVRVALKNMGIRMPPSRITINLSPADVPKLGTAFDLAVAAGMLVSLGKAEAVMTEGRLFLGELGLNGAIKPIKGVLPLVKLAAEAGMKACLVPAENAAEGAAIEGVKVFGISHIGQMAAYLQKGERDSGLTPCGTFRQTGETEKNIPDFVDMRGQEVAKRAAQVAAAGFHHMLLTGPPGSGKSMLARRFSHLLPPLSREESLEVSAIYSVAGKLPTDRLMDSRPFVSPHHTVSDRALAGGGRVPAPGAVTLAHRGVLFLDELPEFRREALEVLRQPLEEKVIRITRTTGVFAIPRTSCCWPP